MKNKSFQTIFSELQKNKITPEEAKVLFAELKNQKQPPSRINSEGIAVIGMAGQFPDALDVNAFWKNLIQGHDAIHELPPHYLNPVRDANGKIRSYPWGGVLAERDCFDPLFFNIAPREAGAMNPHQRLILQESWKALEDAGYNPKKLADSQVGIFIGAEPSGYAHESFTGASDAIVASRLSYYLDLKGPAIVVNTGCSSSGAAIHLACESLRSGESTVAIAGGVSANLCQEELVELAEIGMLSPTGRCWTFDESGDGTVLSEGVGVVVLKRLSDAISAGDHIYGVIVGSGMNQDGASNGITSPNGAAQERLITSVYQRYGIDPEEITYVETHGTGTKLGDPIEANALIRAFRRFSNRKKYCVLGSAKAQIGHTAAAAGVIGLIKVLLSMRHHQIPGFIHFHKLNPMIELEDSAFYLATETMEWKPANGKPLTAALNTFGHSGTNVHLVIQEFIAPEETPNRTPGYLDQSNSFIVPLSAKNQERLKEYTGKLLDFLRETTPGVNPVALAYTLQTGRDAMDARVVFLINDIPDLIAKLAAFYEGREEITNCWHGQAREAKRANHLLAADDDMQEVVKKWLSQGKFEKIAKLWAQGFSVDWELLYGEVKPQRLSLPTYPFARERFWISKTNPKPSGIESSLTALLHPLLHQNTSDLSGQRFSSIFTGAEYYLADYQVKGRRVFPGAAGLEMARAAIEMAAGALTEGWNGIQLKDVVWERPICAGEQPFQVSIGLFPGSNDEIAYQIYSSPVESGGTPGEQQSTIHGHGSGDFISVTEIPVLDIPSIQAQCSQKELDASEVYEALQTMGIGNGPGYRAIEKLYTGTNQLLVKLSLPASVQDTQDSFILHPSIMVSAFQAADSLMDSLNPMDKARHHEPILAFAIDTLDVFGGSAQAMWAWVRRVPSRGEEFPKLDIDLCDERGKVGIRIKGYSPQALAESVEAESHEMEAIEGTVLLAPVWDRVPHESGPEPQPSTVEMAIIGGTKANWDAIRRFYPKAREIRLQPQDTIPEIAKKLEAHGPMDQLLWIGPDEPVPSVTDEALIENQNRGVLQVFRMIKALLALGYGARKLGWTMITTQTQPIHANRPINPTHASLYGLAGSLAKEYPNWTIRVVDLEAGLAAGDWPMADIFSLPGDPQGNHWVYRERQWYRQQLLPIHPMSRPLDRTRYRTQGVYVVIGGAGGIGEAWSEYMIRTYQAKIVWIGRRPMDAAIQAKMDRLGELGPTPEYIAADATDRNALERAYELIKKRYYKIHGVIHSAIVLLDRSLQNMEEERFLAGLSAKVDVSVRLAQVFGREPLDFILFFSSMQSFVKAPGQSNYAAGCTFKDAFAHQLGLELPCTVKVINWGYWGSVGIVASENYQNRMSQAGVGSIEPPEAMETLETLLAGPTSQIAMLKTTRPLEGMNPDGEWVTFLPPALPSLVQNMKSRIQIPAGLKGTTAAAPTSQDLAAQVADDLVRTAARLLKVGTESIDTDSELMEYGFDQFKLAEFTRQLNWKYQLELAPTIFPEYSTLRQLAAYLVENYQDKLAEYFPMEDLRIPEKSGTGNLRSLANSPGKEMEILLGGLLWAQLRSIGIFQQKQVEHSELIKASGIVDLYRRWLEESLMFLTRQNYLQFDGKSYTIIHPAPIDIRAAWEEWDQKKGKWLKDPDLKAQVILLETTLRALPEILTGKARATDVIFPNSSMELVEGVYQRNILADAFNEVVANIVIAYLKERLEQEKPSTPIRIIEIGAGTGGTSTMVFRKLAPYCAHIEEYCYTDISKAFLLHAEKEYGPGNPYLTYRIFNVEHPAAAQGITPGKYDLAIAANVLHATQNIRQTVRNAKAVLKNNGLLILNEITGNSLFTHLTFGLLEGWWRYEDPELRIPGCPGLCPETWRAVLENEGFRSVFFPAREAHPFGQQIIVAESNGVIRLKESRTINERAIEKRDEVPQLQSKNTQHTIPQTTGISSGAPKSGLNEGVHITRQMAMEHVKEIITGKLSESLKVAISIIDMEAPFADYGVDSITGVHLIQIINESLNIQLTTTDLFDYSSVNQLAQYILSQHEHEIMAALGNNAAQAGSDTASITTRVKPLDNAPTRVIKRKVFNRMNIRESLPLKSKANAGASILKTPIAIIGMSGRFAKSATVDELWEHLAAGTDLVQEIKPLGSCQILWK